MRDVDVLREALKKIAPPIVISARGELSQAKFGKIYGVNQQTISDWEKGDFPPLRIPLLAQFAGKKVSQLLFEIATLCVQLENRSPHSEPPTKRPAP